MEHDLARPQFDKPRCRVMLVCGAPASGKTTYVRNHAAAVDQIIDFDLIGNELGIGRERTGIERDRILIERNKRLSDLATAPASHVVWVVLTAASKTLRLWWQRALGVREGDTIVLTPSRQELRKRVLADPDRRFVVEHHFELIDQWLARERSNDPGYISSSCAIDGAPLDPLHAWNR